MLVIRLGALGDLILSLGAFAAIRAHHRDAFIILLTRGVYAACASEMPYFDDVWIDDDPRIWRIGRVLDLQRRLRDGRFTRVYDLQTSDRSGWYFRLHPHPRPAWSGIVRGCSLRHDDLARTTMHTIDRQRAQLALAGIAAGPKPNVDWAQAPIEHLGLPRRYAVLVPGSSGHRPDKRWPVERYGALADWLAGKGLAPLLVGTEVDLLGSITAAAPAAVNLCGRTTVLELAAILRRAAVAIGNDNGPMHLAAAAGCPCLVLFGAASDPAKTAPRGDHVRIVGRPRLDDLAVAAVTDAFGFLHSGMERPYEAAP
ncbi:MAG: glycosyltransferase family 9 protein [Alphaproteobacteria bacterium]|nr:glycosyltransferase family 9 protein [Alphaproteobacteria bacterium]